MFVRRQLHAAALGMALLALQHAATPRATAQSAAPIKLQNDPFALGVASGMPRPDSVVLWTRLAGDFLDNCAQCHRENAIVRYAIYTDDTLKTIWRKGQVLAQRAAAFSVHLHVQGLQAGRHYWYQFFVGDAASPVGRTRTAPALHAPVSALRLALASCQNFEQGYFSAHREIAQQDLDAVLFVGDYIYEGLSSRAHLVASERRHAMPQNGRACTTLADYRARHAQYKGDLDLQAAHAAHPWIMTWDDHEVSNDYANDLDQAFTNPQVFLARRAAAYQAYFEHMPLLIPPQGSTMRIHDRFAWGQLADIWTLDCRQYRSHHACPDAIKGGGRVVIGCDALADDSRTMLGHAQEAWLTQGLRSSQRRWRLLAQSTLVATNGANTPFGRTSFTDGWDGYPMARQRLLRSIAGEPSAGQPALDNVVLLGGDIHQNVAANLRLVPNDEMSPVVASEFVSTSVSTRGLSSSVAQAMLSNNSDLLHLRSDQRGYALIDCNAQTLRCTFRSTPHPALAHAVLATQAAYTVAAGRAGIQKA